MAEDLHWLVTSLETDQILCPKTLVFAHSIISVCNVYEFLMSRLGERAFVDGVIKQNRCTISMFHAHVDESLQKHILTEFRKSNSVIRLIVCTVAFGMGIEIADVRHVVHWGKLSSLTNYWQQVGRCGRDGLPATGTWYTTSIAGSGSDRDVLVSLRDGKSCLRKVILNGFRLATSSMQQQELQSLDQRCIAARSCDRCSCAQCTCCAFCRRQCQCTSVNYEE